MGNPWENPMAVNPVEVKDEETNALGKGEAGIEEGGVLVKKENPETATAESETSVAENPEILRAREKIASYREHDLEVEQAKEVKDDEGLVTKDRDNKLTMAEVLASPEKLSQLDFFNMTNNRRVVDRLLAEGIPAPQIATTIMAGLKAGWGKVNETVLTAKLSTLPNEVSSLLREVDKGFLIAKAREMQTDSKQTYDYKMSYAAAILALPLKFDDWKEMGMDTENLKSITNNFASKLKTDVEQRNYPGEFIGNFTSKFTLINALKGSEKKVGYKREEVLRDLHAGLKLLVDIKRVDLPADRQGIDGFGQVVDSLFAAKREGVLTQEELDGVLKI